MLCELNKGSSACSIVDRLRHYLHENSSLERIATVVILNHGQWMGKIYRDGWYTLAGKYYVLLNN